MFYENDEATVRYIGPTCLGPGLWVGIEFKYPGVKPYKFGKMMSGSHNGIGVSFALQTSE